MSAHTKPEIAAWYANKIDATTAEIVLVGSGFGDIPGTGELQVVGIGRVNPTVKQWSNTTVILEAPVDETINVARVITAGDSRGQNKQRARSAPSEDRSTGDALAATWSVATIDDLEDSILVDGADLDGVATVVLIDTAIPQQFSVADFEGSATQLDVEWPIAYSSTIGQLVLLDSTGNMVDIHDAPAPGWQPAPNGILTNAAGVLLPGGGPGLNLFGSSLGAGEGIVRIQEQGGTLQPANVIQGGWSDTLIQVAADANTTYDDFEVTRTDDEVATKATSFPATVTTPALSTVELTAYAQTQTGGPFTFRAEGVSLSGVARIILGMNAGNIVVYNPAVWGVAQAAQFNAGNFINTPPIWLDGSVEYTLDAAAAGYIGGKSALGIAALTQSGQQEASLDFTTPEGAAFFPFTIA